MSLTPYIINSSAREGALASLYNQVDGESSKQTINIGVGNQISSLKSDSYGGIPKGHVPMLRNSLYHHSPRPQIPNGTLTLKNIKNDSKPAFLTTFHPDQGNAITQALFPNMHAVSAGTTNFDGTYEASHQQRISDSLSIHTLQTAKQLLESARTIESFDDKMDIMIVFMSYVHIYVTNDEDRGHLERLLAIESYQPLLELYNSKDNARKLKIHNPNLLAIREIIRDDKFKHLYEIFQEEKPKVDWRPPDFITTPTSIPVPSAPIQKKEAKEEEKMDIDAPIPLTFNEPAYLLKTVALDVEETKEIQQQSNFVAQIVENLKKNQQVPEKNIQHSTTELTKMKIQLNDATLALQKEQENFKEMHSQYSAIIAKLADEKTTTVEALALAKEENLKMKEYYIATSEQHDKAVEEWGAQRNAQIKELSAGIVRLQQEREKLKNQNKGLTMNMTMTEQEKQKMRAEWSKQFKVIQQKLEGKEGTLAALQAQVEKSEQEKHQLEEATRRLQLENKAIAEQSAAAMAKLEEASRQLEVITNEKESYTHQITRVFEEANQVIIARDKDREIFTMEINNAKMVAQQQGVILQDLIFMNRYKNTTIQSLTNGEYGEIDAIPITKMSGVLDNFLAHPETQGAVPLLFEMLQKDMTQYLTKRDSGLISLSDKFYEEIDDLNILHDQLENSFLETEDRVIAKITDLNTSDDEKQKLGQTWKDHFYLLKFMNVLKYHESFAYVHKNATNNKMRDKLNTIGEQLLNLAEFAKSRNMSSDGLMKMFYLAQMYRSNLDLIDNPPETMTAAAFNEAIGRTHAEENSLDNFFAQMNIFFNSVNQHIQLTDEMKRNQVVANLTTAAQQDRLEYKPLLAIEGNKSLVLATDKYTQENAPLLIRDSASSEYAIADVNDVFEYHDKQLTYVTDRITLASKRDAMLDNSIIGYNNLDEIRSSDELFRAFFH